VFIEAKDDGTRGVDPEGLGVRTPWKYVGGQSMFWPPPLKMSHYFIQNCCCITASFTMSRMNTWTYIITSLILLMLTMLPSYFWSTPTDTCPPINVFVAPLGLSCHGPIQNSKTWVRWPVIDKPH